MTPTRPRSGQVLPIRPPGHEDAARIALRWLEERHRKGWQRAVHELLDEWSDGNPIGADAALDEGAAEMLGINASEWLLARGHIHARGALRNITEHLLGPEGPALTPPQQRWLAQLREKPLRLLRVAEVRPGEGMTLLDELDHAAEPMVVREISGSRSARAGDLLGARVMQVGEPSLESLELSGAVYPFSKLAETAVIAAVRDAATEARQEGLNNDEARDRIELEIARRWLAQWIGPPALPKIVHAGTGEPMLLITDHYRVLDRDALAAALAAQPDVSGDARSGWHREADAGGGTRRSVAAVNPGKAADRIEVFYPTQGLADAGRRWFEGLAGPSVAHLTREIADPTSAAAAGSAASGGPEIDLPPEELAQLVDQFMRRHYANWCDEPIPALGNLTPRQAITTPAGLERVKGLLREYEAGERDASAEQGREPFSFQFLWDALGIPR